METTIDSGNFAVKISGDIREAKREATLANGVKYDAQRGGLSAAWIALAGEKNENGKVRLPAKFKRNSVEFDEAKADVMRGALEEWAKGLFDDGFSVEVTKYEGGEGAASPMKRATALVDSFLGTDMEAAYRQILGSPDGDRDALIAIANERGLGIQPPRNGGASTEEDGDGEES